MQKKIKRILEKTAKKILPRSWRLFIGDFLQLPRRVRNNEKNLQGLVELLLRNESISKNPKAGINKYELKFCSSGGVDGLLLYIFSKTGTANHRFVEIGVGNGKECNTANLALNFGWSGLMLEAHNGNANFARYYYKNYPVKVLYCWVTAENINKILLENDIKGEIDLLSIDINGNDYWIWKAVDIIKPRVVVIEYNRNLKDKEVVKYDPNFDRDKEPSGKYGASLQALKELAGIKGYKLICCDSLSSDAVFVHKNYSL